MAERPTASPSGRRHPARSAQPSSEQNTDTARISLYGGRSAVPGWFWGLLGCLTVLGVGFAGLFVVVRFLPASTTAAVTAPGGVDATSPAGARGGGIQVEQLASPPPPGLAPLPAARARPAPRGMKVARSPSALRPSAQGAAAPGEAEPAPAAQKAVGDGDGAGKGGDGEKAAGDEPPRPRKGTAPAGRDRREREAPAAAADDDDDDGAE
jgi:hypothetical protein